MRSIPTIDDDCGFTTLVNFIRKYQKPVVMHNGIIDSMHLYDKFVDNLPSNLTEFKDKFSEAFPNVYDTKHILRTSVALAPYFGTSLSSSALGKAYSKVLGSKFEFDDKVEIHGEVRDQVPTYESCYEIFGSASHEAGFDALMTGILFYKLATALDENKQFNMKTLNQTHPNPFNIMYKNRIPLARRTPINLNLKGTSGDGVYKYKKVKDEPEVTEQPETVPSVDHSNPSPVEVDTKGVE